jgi:Amt family ammonium transporter
VLVVAAPERRHPQIDDCLKAWGCSSEPATSLREAIDALVHAETAGTPFVAVLLDVRTATGEDAVLLQELVGGEPPTIGWGLSDDAQEAAGVRGLGLWQWLRDPVLPSDLYNALATSLGMACAPPLEDAPDNAAEPPRLEISGHVLVAEDNRINQMYIVELLKQCGCTCDLAANGHEALEAVQHRMYDLVLMDCQMPKMDGLTATREIRRREALQETSSRLPIVALTANALQGDRERCLEAGMDDYLTKPLETHVLYATLKKTIGTRSEERAVSADPTQDRSLAVAPFDAEGLLTRCSGNLDFVCSLLEEFETSGCERVEAIRRSAAQQDAHAAAEAAHALKGAAGILCATSLSKVAEQVEAMGRSGDLEGIGPLVDELTHELQQCLTYLPTLREETRTAQNVST